VALLAAGFIAAAILGVTIWLATPGGGWLAFWPVFMVLAGGLVALWRLVDKLLVAHAYDHRSLPARPEFYDFGDREHPMHWQEIGGKRLKDLHYVVFDTETTGLRPSDGDEIISIAALRLEGGALDEANSFSRLVNPGRPIPEGSIRFHGITDDMVEGERPIGDVLPEFIEFVGDAVLVAHNAAFDMRFLEMKEDQLGIPIPHLVLDTLLLSVFLEQQSENHSLDAIAGRMGISIEGRHTALGDALATAKVFMKFLVRLESRGITTLRQAIEVSARVEDVRKLRGKF